MPIEEAAASWNDNVYMPVVGAIRSRHGMLARLGGWTEADLYVEATRRWLRMSEASAEADPHRAVHELMLEPAQRRWRRRRAVQVE